MRLPIDSSQITFMCARSPQPVTDFETKRPRTDLNGEPLYGVQMVAFAADESMMINVRVAGEPTGCTQGVPLRVTGLTANPWAMGDRTGVSFAATKIEPLLPAAGNGASAAAGAAHGAPAGGSGSAGGSSAGGSSAATSGSPATARSGGSA